MNRLLGVGLCLVLLSACKREKVLPACVQPPFTLNIITTASDSCMANGVVDINGPANGGYEYRINDGPYQGSSQFTGMAAGRYRFSIKTASCLFSDSVTVPAAPPGPLFTGVRNLLALRCFSCHNTGNAQGGVDLTQACTIVSKAQRILSRAVLGNEPPMPPAGLLPLGEVNVITLWYARGAKYTD